MTGTHACPAGLPDPQPLGAPADPFLAPGAV